MEPGIDLNKVPNVIAVLRDQALTVDEAEAFSDHGQTVVGWAGNVRTWNCEFSLADSEVTAHTKTIRATPEEAVADAVQLRRALLDAAGWTETRGYVAADTVSGRKLEVLGWIGAVYVKFEYPIAG